MFLHATRPLFNRTTIVRVSQSIRKEIAQHKNLSPFASRASSSLSVFEKQKYDLIEEKSVLTNRDAIRADTGLRQFITRVYNYTGASVVATIALGSAMAQSVPAHPGFFFLAGIVLSYGGLFGIQGSKFQVVRQLYLDSSSSQTALSIEDNSPKHSIQMRGPNHLMNSSHHHHHQAVEVLSSKNSVSRMVSYGAFLTGISMFTAPSLLVYPEALVPAFLASSSVFGSAALYAYAKPVGALEAWGPALYSALGGLVFSGFSGLISQLIFGPNPVSECLFDINLYAGIPVFAAFIAYDTHKAVQVYQNGVPDHIGCSVELYLDFMNLFLRFMEIFGKMQKNRN
jgi:FtsH-binding integral membrane protein